MIGPLVFAGIALAGGAGAAARYLVDTAIAARVSAYPLGTLVINVSGSFLLGAVLGWAAGGMLSAELALILGGGFLGGYTTFSTASAEAVRLARAGRLGVAFAHAAGMAVLSIAAAAGGLLLGGLV